MGKGTNAAVLVTSGVVVGLFAGKALSIAQNSRVVERIRDVSGDAFERAVVFATAAAEDVADLVYDIIDVARDTGGKIMSSIAR